MPTSVALTPHFEKLTQKLVSSGQYNNVSEVIRDGLRMVEERQKAQQLKFKALRAAIKRGTDDIKAGRYTEINSPQEMDAFFEEIAMGTKRPRTKATAQRQAA